MRRPEADRSIDGLSPTCAPPDSKTAPLFCFSNADHTAGEARAGIADRLTAVVDFGMHDDAAANDGIFRSGNADVVDGYFVMGMAVVVGLHIAKITGVPLRSLRQRVRMAFGVVMAPGAHPVRGRTIAKLMNMHGVLLSGVEPFQMSRDLDGIANLREADFAVCLVAGSRMKHGHRLFDRRPGGGMSFFGVGSIRGPQPGSSLEAECTSGGDSEKQFCSIHSRWLQ